MCTSSTFSNWCWRIMPRVSFPDAPASERKQGVCATYFIGKASAATIWSRTRLVTGTSAVGIKKNPGSPCTAEQVLFEFRQLPGALQRFGVHQIRHVGLAITVFADVHVEHELDERAVQPRE